MLKTWMMAFRPKTLTAAVVPVIVGTALSYLSSDTFKWWITFCALGGALFIQIGTNLINDAIDFKKGADDENRLGPQRVTQSGLVNGRTVMAMGVFSFVLAVLAGIPLVIQGGWVIVAIGLISIACGYAYTGGPYPLAYRGMGDLFVILFFGLVAVGGVFYLQSGIYTAAALVAGLQVGLLCTVLIAVNNLRDIEGDRRVKKNTLAVRFGKSFVRVEVYSLFVLAFALNFFWWQQGLHYAALLPLVTLPMAIRLAVQIHKNEPGPIYNQYLAKAAAVHLLFGLLLVVGLVVG